MIKIKFDNFVCILLVLTGFILPNNTMFNYTFHLPSLFNVIYVFIALFVFFIYKHQKKFNAKNIDKTYIFLFLIFYAWMIIGVLFNLNHIPTNHPYLKEAVGINSVEFRSIYYGLFRPLIFLLFSCILFIFLDSFNHITNMIKGMFYLAISSSLYAFYQFIGFSFNWPLTAIFSGHVQQDITLMGFRRVEGMFYEPGPFATFLAPMLIILFFILLANKHKDILKIDKKLLILNIFMCFIVLLLTFSPIAYLIPLTALIIYFFLNIKKLVLNKKMLMYFSTFVLTTFIFLNILFNFTISNIFGNDNLVGVKNYLLNKVMYQSFISDDQSVLANPDERATRNLAALNMLKKSPILGVGVGNAIFNFYQNIPYFQNVRFKKIDMASNGIINVYFNILAETGIVGLFLFVLFIFYPIFLYFKYKKTISKHSSSFLVQGFFISYLTFILIPTNTYLCIWNPFFWMLNITLIRLIKVTVNELKQNNIGLIQ